MDDNNKKHALFVYADQHPPSSLDHGFRITRISLAGLTLNHREKIRGQTFDYVLLMDKITRDDLQRIGKDAYTALCNSLLTKGAPIISDFTTFYPNVDSEIRSGADLANQISARSSRLGATFNHDPSAVERAS